MRTAGLFPAVRMLLIHVDVYEMFTYNTNGTVSKKRVFTGEVNSITYDTVGNPTGYYNGAAMTWQKGRQLATYASGGTTTAYTYDVTGQRVRKTIGSTVHDFVSEGGRANSFLIRK